MMSESNLKKKAGSMKDNPLAGHSPSKRANNHDMKDLGMVEDLKGKGKKHDIDKLSSSGLGAENFEDSFQKLYSKELDLDEDEVPIILHELNDSAIHFISREQFERSLSLLQKAQTLLDRLQFQKNPNDRFLVQVTMHNMALCFQKMGALEECALCLDACLHQLNSQYLLPKFQGSPTKKLKKLKYECKIHMQVCALLSQLHRHSEALCHAKRAVQISQYLIRDLQGLCKVNYEKSCEAKVREQVVHEEIERKRDEEKKKKKKDNKGPPDTYLSSLSRDDSTSKLDLIYYEHSVSMLERTAYRVYPIINAVAQRMVPEKDVEKPDLSQKSNVQTPVSADQHALNMKVLLGYLNQSEWLFLLNIGNIMQITPLTIHDLYTSMSIDVELARDAVLEKICYLCISYFCVSTELRFLVQTKEKLVINQTQVKQESEFWHAKALEISCSFLPSESPLVSHILSSYQKHHAPVQESIPEDDVQDNAVKVIRPIKGIDKCQYQPIVRFNKNLSIALSPLNLSPNNYGAKKPIVTEIERAGVRNQPRLEPQHTADYAALGTGVQSVSITQNKESKSAQKEKEEEIKLNIPDQLDNISSGSEVIEQIQSDAPNPQQQKSQLSIEQKEDLNTIPTDMSIQARTKQQFPPKLSEDQEKDLRYLIKNSSDSKEQQPIRNQRPQTGTNRKNSADNNNGFQVQKQGNALSQGGTFKTDESNGDQVGTINSRFQFHSNKVPGEQERPKSKHGPPQSAKAGQPTQGSLDNRVNQVSKNTITQESSDSIGGSIIEKRSSASGIMLTNQMNQMSGSTNKSSGKIVKNHQSKFDKKDADKKHNLIPNTEAKSKKNEIKSHVVSNKGTGRLFENLDESLEPNSVTQNSMEIPRQSSASSGSRKVKRPSSNQPKEPVNIQVLTQNQLDNSINNISNRSSSVGRTRRKLNDQNQPKTSKLTPNLNLNEGSKHSFASNNNVSSTKDLHSNIGGNKEHSRSVLTQQRSQNFLSAKSNRTINQEPSRHGDIRINEMGSRESDLFQDANQITETQTRHKTTQQKTQQNFMVGPNSQSLSSLVKPNSQPAKNGQRGNANLIKKQSPSQGKSVNSSSKQGSVGNYQKQKQFKDMIGLLVLQQQAQKNLPGSKTSVNTPNVHSNQGTANVVSLLQNIPTTTSLEMQKQNLVQSVLNNQTNPPSRRKSASSKGKAKQQKLVQDFQTQLNSNNKFVPALTTSQSQVAFTSAINNQNGVASSESVRHKVNQGNNQGLSSRIDELMMGVGNGPGGFEFAGKQTKSQTNLQLQKNQQKSIQSLFNQRVGGLDKQHHSRAEAGNHSQSKSQEKKQKSSNKQNSNIAQFNSVINSSNNHMSKLNQVYQSQNINSNAQFSQNMPTALIGSKMSSKHLQKLQQQRVGANDRYSGQASGPGQKKERELTPVFPNQQQQATQLTRPDQMFPGSLGQGTGSQSQGKFMRPGGQPAVLTANQIVTADQFNMKGNKHKKHQGAVTAVPVAGAQDAQQRSRVQQAPSSNSAVDIQAQVTRTSKTEVPSPNGGRDMMQQWSRH